MKLEEMEKICERATPGPWEWMGNSRIRAPSNSMNYEIANVECRHNAWPEDAKFIAVSRDLMPKLLVVAKQAKIQHECGDPYYAHAEIGKALEDLERE